MCFKIEPITEADGVEIIDIFNYYTENGFSAYSSAPISCEMFDAFLDHSNGYPAYMARSIEGVAVGFGMLRPYSPMPVFTSVAEITCFLRYGFTGRGIGQLILDRLFEDGARMGLRSILASISSLNEQSLHFHRKNGFIECGRFRGIGEKFGRVFDVVYCQKMLEERIHD